MKVIHVLLIIIFILALVLGIKISNSKQQRGSSIEIEQISKLNNDKLDLEEIKELINKSENIKNYSLITNIDKDAEIKYKDGKIVFLKNNSKIFIDYEENSKKAIIITEDNKTAAKIDKKNLIKIDSIKEKKENFYSLIDNCEKYKINKNVTFNNFDCVSITAFNKYNAGEGWSFGENLEQYNGKTVETNILIDKNTGIIMKITSKIDKKETINEYYYKFNCVTEEDINVPDLSEYKIVE